MDIKKILLITVGTIFLILGIFGLLLPILPTTPFLLLTAYFYGKSSDKLYFALMKSNTFGKYIYNYKYFKAVESNTKKITLTILWVTLLISIYKINISMVKIILITIGVGVTHHVCSLRMLSNSQKKYADKKYFKYIEELKERRRC